MINRNEANYTNFGDNKTNKRIVQAPGGSSSLSLGWGGSNEDYSRNNQKQSMNSKQNYSGQQANDSYGQNYGGNKNNNYAYQAQEAYEEPMHVMGNYDKKGSNGNQIGGENGYNMITNQPNTYQNYPPTSKYQQQQNYEEKSDPASFYKPSSSGYKSTQLQEYDMALEQQKHKIESSRGQRNPQSSSNSVYQQSSNDTKPCVKIHQQRNNDIFGGGQYDYWYLLYFIEGNKTDTAVNKETPRKKLNSCMRRTIISMAINRIRAIGEGMISLIIIMEELIRLLLRCIIHQEEGVTSRLVDCLKMREHLEQEDSLQAFQVQKTKNDASFFPFYDMNKIFYENLNLSFKFLKIKKI